jgi:hypothetical protein
MLAVVFSVGRVVLNFFRNVENRYYRTFLALLTGILTVTILFALIRSGGKSIMIILLPLIASWMWLHRKQLQKWRLMPNHLLSDFLLAASIMTIFYTYAAYFYFDLEKGIFKSLFIDAYYYADFSNSLKLWGIESKFYEMNHFLSDH